MTERHLFLANKFAIKWFCDSFSWHVREFYRFLNGQMTAQEAEEVEIYYGEDDPTERGWYGRIYISGCDGYGSDVWGGAEFWDGKKWSEGFSYPGNRSEKPFDLEDTAHCWARERAW
jgi:hypothetical protein